MATLLLVTALAAVRVARAQPSPAPDPPVVEVPSQPAAAPTTATLTLSPDDLWTEWELKGALLESASQVRAMLTPEVESRQVLNEAAREGLAAACARLGYHLVELTTQAVAGGRRATLVLDPIPMVRSVDIELDQSFLDVVLDDQIERRLQIGAGTYLPWPRDERDAALAREAGRIEEYLQGEGFFDARATVRDEARGPGAVRLRIEVRLGDAYQLGAVGVSSAGALAVSPSEIRGLLRHRRCVVWPVCFGTQRFTRAQLRADLERIREVYQRRGYPAARVTSDFDVRTSVHRATRTVRFSVIVDQRRQLDVVFEGHDPSETPDDELRALLTFNLAGSGDDLEAADSAKAIAAYFQARGRFDTQVSWTRERFAAFDRILYRIDRGPKRSVRAVRFVGNRAIDAKVLAGIVATRPAATGLLAARQAASGAELALDADRIAAAYRARGFLETQVSVAAAPADAAATDPTRAATWVSAERGARDIYVRFTIEEGRRTRVALLQVVRATPARDADAASRCAETLRRAAEALRARLGPVTEIPNGCRAAPTDLALDPGQAPAVADAVRDGLWERGYPDATATARVDREGPRRHDAIIELVVDEGRRLTIGQVAVRGAFRTRASLVQRQLGFAEGAPVTAARLAEGAAALRATGLFESVAIERLTGRDSPDGVAHFVVRVRERHDARLYVEGEAGISSLNGFFGKAKFTLPNIAGLGLSTDASVTLGTLFQAVEGTARAPRWLLPQALPVSFDTDVLAYWRRQDTDRFGDLVTQGASLALSRTFKRERGPSAGPRVVTTTVRYDYRLRNRDEDALRGAGPDADLAEVPVVTRIGSIGVNLRWDQRTDRAGNLNPLAPSRGFALEADASLASPALGGSDVFVKLSGAIKRFQPLGDRLSLRTELRLDQGIPLAGAALLPEVERFFAGGDDTVRGYDDDRLATERIEVPVPPFDGLTQVKIAARGGNLRAIGSVDLELRLWNKAPVATAVFVDAGFVRNTWRGLDADAIRPALGLALGRFVTAFGSLSVEYAIPLDVDLGEDPRGRWHFGFAMRL